VPASVETNPSNRPPPATERLADALLETWGWSFLLYTGGCLARLIVYVWFVADAVWPVDGLGFGMLLAWAGFLFVFCPWSVMFRR